MNINPSVIRVLVILITIDRSPSNTKFVKIPTPTPFNRVPECEKSKRYFKNQKDYRIAKALSLAG